VRRGSQDGGPNFRRIEFSTLAPLKVGPPHVPYYRISTYEITELCAVVHATGLTSGRDGYPPILSLFKSVVVALAYLRRNHVQQELAEYYGVSQSTISRAITAVTPALARALREFTPTAEDLPRGEQMIVDGSLVSCWSWANHTELYSGKHRTTGMNIQVVCDLAGRLRWISDPVDGSRHDSAALRASGALDAIDPSDWIGDKGYVGLGMITPIKKPPHRDLLDWEKGFNTAINRIRWKIEQTIANLKTWRILHSDYRRPLETFADTISAVVGLQFFRVA
jgi:DDE superfamily endonuclease/Helix-turn-helix of DDE superfamily endonuclease